MFLPTTIEEVKQQGWDGLDIILITGDAYIDSSYIGVAVIGKVLLKAGFRVGIIAQPDVSSDRDICRLGEPKLFWGITGGCIDSMVANRTASGKRRKSDDYTAGGINNHRPDRAVLVYSNLIRRFFKKTRPLVLGGIEASLRRISHYDYWSNSIRRSILFDAKADFLLYGMAERSVVELAASMRDGVSPHSIRGLCYPSTTAPDDYIQLPSFQETARDEQAFTDMFQKFYVNNDPVSATGLAQKQDSRYLIQNPPARYLTENELDDVYRLEFERDVHPYYGKKGAVKALSTIRFAISTHRGCYGECNFCAIAVHQGRTVRWRSKKSIVAEARQIAKHPLFKGRIFDVGGPTANMYGFECEKKKKIGSCVKKRCLFPKICSSLKIDHSPQIDLLRQLRNIPGIKKIIVASGIRYDMIAADKKNGLRYLREVIRHYVSGQLKVAPEHSEPRVLAAMGKPGQKSLLSFRKLFTQMTKQEGKKQFLTYYMIAAHPGCTVQDMLSLKKFSQKELKLLPRQVQIFTPTPSTWSTLMYWTGKNPFTGKSCFVEKSFQGREKQKGIVMSRKSYTKK